MTTPAKLRWGILGTGHIAKVFARDLAASRTGELTAVGSRTAAGAEAFGQEFQVPHRHASYESLLSDPDVQAVYISTPHPWHAEWAIRAAEAGKHILCEKPLAMNAAEAMAVIEAAARHDVFLMEAFMYRCHPQTARLVELLQSGVIGPIRLLHAVFSFHGAADPSSRLLNPELGGGGILDVGCYPMSMARLVAGVALGRDFADPIQVVGAGRVGPTGVDEYAAATLQFPGDIVAQVACGVQLQQDSVVRIYGSNGNILVPSPWFCSRAAGRSTILVHRRGEAKPEEIVIECDRGLYTVEADTVALNLERRQAPSPAMTWADSLGNMRALDRWRRAVGVSHPADRPERWARPVHGRPLRVRADARMSLGRIPGLDRPVSRLIMGTMIPDSIPHAFVLYDHFFESGGNALDTARVYRGGRSEELVGRWIAARGVRNQVVIVGKGAHTPNCTPEGVTRELRASLEALQTDWVDIYLLHRDNPEVPVAEFVDVLNEHRREGRLRVFGGSNWTLPRVEEANAYARRRGLQGFDVVSNNVCLARMVEPVWQGTVASSDAASRAWLARSGVASLAWSSQARGFFARGRPDDRSEPELVRCWYSEDNFRRLERAQELARERGVEPVQVALAWVLNQPFNSFALIGPATPLETTSCLRALDIRLTPEEIEWLNLERDTRAVGDLR